MLIVFINDKINDKIKSSINGVKLIVLFDEYYT